MLTIREAGHADLEKFYSLFEVDFDSEELLSRLTIHRGLLNGTLELLIFFDDDSGIELAYALAFKKSLYNYVLLKYFAVLPWYRGKGMGIECMRLLNKRYADRQGILAELTEFDDPEPDHLKKLFRFFSRFGYVEAPVDYRIGGTRAHLMVKPIRGTAEIAPVAHRILPDFYSRCTLPRERERMIDIKRK